MDSDHKLELITRNLDQIINSDELVNIVQVRSPKAYWGTACTGTPHIGYFMPLLKIADMLEAGCEVTILIADLHAYLDNKTNLEDLDSKATFYENLLRATIMSLNAPCEHLKFVRGRNHQLSPEYTMDVYRLCYVLRLQDSLRAGNSAVKESTNPLLSGMMYPLLQVLDEEYIGADLQLGGMDQTTIFSLAMNFLPKIGYNKPRIYLMNKMQIGLNGEEKMHASKPNSKINLLDTLEEIQRKIKKSKMIPGDTNNNCILGLIEHIIIPILDRNGETFMIERSEEYGGDREYRTYNELESDYIDESLHPCDIKPNVSRYIDKILTPIRDHLGCDYP